MSEAKVEVRAWTAEGVLLEHYRYTAGAVTPLPKHAHAEYQFGLSVDCGGEYRYRGALHRIPIGSLSVIQSGEAHSPSDRTLLDVPASFWMMHLDPSWLERVASEVAERPMPLPVFPSSCLADADVVRSYRQLSAGAASQLEQESQLLWFLARILRHADRPPAVRPLKPVQASVLRVRDFLEANYAASVSLQGLAQIADLSSFHLCRAFRQQLGIPPHIYQNQTRIARAKPLLMQGLPIAEVAALTGFYDQSHFTSHFKRLVGVTPKNYVSEQKIAKTSYTLGDDRRIY